VCPGASMQPGDHDGVFFAERRHDEIAAQEASTPQVLGHVSRVFADFGEFAEDFRKVDGADGRAAKQRVLDEIGARFIVEIGEKCRGVEDACRVFQLGLGGLSLYFRSPFGNQLIGEGSISCPRPVNPTCLSDDLTGAREPKRAVRRHHDKELIPVVEVQPLANLSRKHQPSTVS